VQLFSSLKKTGIDEAEEVFARWLGVELPERKRPRDNGSRPEPSRNKKPRAKGG
jgi:hypothetical protein